MNVELERVRDEFIATMGRLASELGLNRVAGQIYALLFVSGKSLSLNEIRDALKVSKGHVSVNVRELQRWGAVRKMWVKGSRRDFYEANLDVIGITTSRLRIGLERRMNEMVEMVGRVEEKLVELEPAVEGEDRENVRVYRERLEKGKQVQQSILTVIRMLAPAAGGS